MGKSNVLTVCLILVLGGCTKAARESISSEELVTSDEMKVLSVILTNGTIITFDSNGGRYIEQQGQVRFYRAIVGMTSEGSAVEVEPDSALEIRIEKKEADEAATVLLAVLGACLATGAILLILLAQAFSGH